MTSAEIKAINSMTGIEVRTDIRAPGMVGSTFQMTQRYAEANDPENLPAAFIHDSFHADQKRRGADFAGIKAEKQASCFAFPILKKMGMSERTVAAYKKDCEEGHGPWGEPKKKKIRK